MLLLLTGDVARLSRSKDHDLVCGECKVLVDNFEETYGVMNEKQVGIGESTCSAVYSATSDTALLSVDEMSKIAMERASSARAIFPLLPLFSPLWGAPAARPFPFFLSLIHI